MSEYTFDCPHCKQSLEAPEELLGQTINCPSCNGSIPLPEPEPQVAPVQDDPPAPSRKIVNNRSKQSGGMKPCPFCGEDILRNALKCKHCGEFLKGQHEVTTNVKQGALIGAIACFAIGILLMFVSLWSFIIYSPLFIVAFILSIVAMSQKRVVGGLAVLLLTLIVPPIIFFSLAAVRGGKAAEKISASMEDVQKEIETAWDRSEYESVVSQINSSRERQSAAAASASLLRRIVVTDPKFYWSEGGFISEPVIDMTVRNQTGQALSRLFFRGTVKSPGRTMAWIDEDFNYSVQGGIEHGEEKHLKLSPNTFGPWGNRDLRERTDLVFTVAVVNAHDANGQRLAEEFGQRDEERLEALLKQKSDLESKMHGQ